MKNISLFALIFLMIFSNAAHGITRFVAPLLTSVVAAGAFFGEHHKYSFASTYAGLACRAGLMIGSPFIIEMIDNRIRKDQKNRTSVCAVSLLCNSIAAVAGDLTRVK